MYHKSKILIVDDIELNRALLCEMFRSEYVILEAEDGQKALEIIECEKESLAIILLDIVMPVMDGFHVLEVMNQKGWMDVIPIVMITAETSDHVMGNGYDLGVMDIITKPFNPNVVKKRVNNVIENFAYKNKLEQMVEEQAKKLQEQTVRMHEHNLQLIDTLTSIIEFKNAESTQHISNIRIITKLLLNKLMEIYPAYRLDPLKIEMISEASSMHDIGKILVPDGILNKKGKLTDEEFEIIKLHTIRGSEVLEHISSLLNMDFYNYCYDICRHHHEKWDGKGYPDGLIGNQITIWSQAVSLADVYDALTSKRVYKAAYSSEEAMRMILDGQCGQFNPELIECLSQILPQLREQKETVKTTKAKAPVKEKSRRPLDVSSRTLQLLELERQKYKIISELSDEVIFEYDANNDKLIFSEEFHKITLDEQILFNVRKNNVLLKYMHEEDYHHLLTEMDQLSSVHRFLQVDMQLKLSSGEYIWHRLTICSLWDISFEVKCMGYVGKIVNIQNEKRKSLELEQAANYDSLTRILNRKAAQKAISEKLATTRHHSAICFLDIDNFKMVNDHYGHMIGDDLLKKVAAVLQCHLGENDIIARLGGDEFVFYVHDYKDEEQLAQSLNKISEALRMDFDGFSISGSIGIACYPKDGESYENLLFKADQALYYSKFNGKDHYHAYSQECEKKPFRSLLTSVDDPEQSSFELERLIRNSRKRKP